MSFLRNRALWVLISAVALYWFMVWAIGSDAARDATDIVVVVIGTVLFFRLVPHAWDRFLQGGGQKHWQVLIGLTLFWAGMVAVAAWGFQYRSDSRPEWMSYSPLNGFFRYWILGAGLLCLSATTEPRINASPTKVYYVAIAFAAGVLIGAAGLRYLSGTAVP